MEGIVIQHSFRLYIVPAIALAVILALLFAYGYFFSDNPPLYHPPTLPAGPTVTPQTLQELLDIVKAKRAVEDQLLLEGAHAVFAMSTLRLSPAAFKQMERVADTQLYRHNFLAQGGDRYTHVTRKYEIENSTINDTTAELLTRETSTSRFEPGDGSRMVNTGESEEHIIEFSRTSGQWLLTTDNGISGRDSIYFSTPTPIANPAFALPNLFPAATPYPLPTTAPPLP